MNNKLTICSPHMWSLRKHILFILATFAFVMPLYAQAKTGLMANIRKEVALINSDSMYKKRTLENEAFMENMTDGGGKLTGYFKNKQIKKIYQWIGLSNGIEITEFYFKNGQLIFVYEQFNSFVYNNKDQPDLTKTETTFEGRYYFHNNKLIDYLTTGHNRFEDDKYNPENILVKQAHDTLKLLTRKNRTD
ncbi:MAG TPA: hypothetical protein VFQ73_12030 [Flavisolibacter sp.]|nr:hypothetical protein [Flavisolibacter sp.]